MTSRNTPKAAAVEKAQQEVERARRKYKQAKAEARKSLKEATRELESIVGRHALQAVHDDPHGTAAQVVGLLPRLSPQELRSVAAWWELAKPTWLSDDVQAAFRAAIELRSPQEFDVLWPQVLEQAQRGELIGTSIIALRRYFGVDQKMAQAFQGKLLETGLFRRDERGALKRIKDQ